MKDIYLYLLLGVFLYFLFTRVLERFNNNIEQENFDPSLVPVSSIVTLAKVAQKLVNGNGTLTNPGNLQIGASTGAPGNLTVMGGTIINGGNAPYGISLNVTGPTKITGDTTVNGVTKITGDTTVNGVTKITGDTTVNGVTKITGATYITGNVNICDPDVPAQCVALKYDSVKGMLTFDKGLKINNPINKPGVVTDSVVLTGPNRKATNNSKDNTGIEALATNVLNYPWIPNGSMSLIGKTNDNADFQTWSGEKRAFPGYEGRIIAVYASNISAGNRLEYGGYLN